MADNHDTLMREIQKELDQEKYQKLWDTYAYLIIGAAFAVVFAVGGYKYWQHTTKTAVEAAGSSYETAIGLVAKESPAADDTAKAVAAFETLAKNGPGGYQALSQLQLAGLHAKSGDKAAALSAYDAVANSTTADSILRDFAALQSTTLRVGDADWTEIENRLNALTGADGAFRQSALQLLGVAAYDAGKIEKARGAFEQLMADPKVSSGMRDRATLYMARIVASDIAAESKDKDGATTTTPVATPDDASPKDSSGGDGDAPAKK